MSQKRVELAEEVAEAVRMTYADRRVAEDIGREVARICDELSSAKLLAHLRALRSRSSP